MKTLQFKSYFDSCLLKNNLKETQILFVNSVKDWSLDHNLKEDNPDRLAIAAKRENSSVWDIVFKKEINQEHIPSVTSAMWYRGFTHYNELTEIEIFIKHTFLHEIAHALGYKTELEADNWAWEELHRK
jgi:hypothetical protein